MQTPDPETLQQQLAELIREQVLESPEELGPDADLFEAGLDSMAIMQLLLLIEERYGTMPPASDLTRENFASPRTLAQLLHQRLNEPAEGGQVGNES